jgi:hypothetical protein
LAFSRLFWLFLGFFSFLPEFVLCLMADCPITFLIPARKPFTDQFEYTERKCRVTVGVCASDYPERCALTGQKGGATAFPCTHCMCPLCQLNDEQFGPKPVPSKTMKTSAMPKTRLGVFPLRSDEETQVIFFKNLA